MLLPGSVTGPLRRVRNVDSAGCAGFSQVTCSKIVMKSKV